MCIFLLKKKKKKYGRKGTNSQVIVRFSSTNICLQVFSFVCFFALWHMCMPSAFCLASAWLHNFSTAVICAAQRRRCGLLITIFFSTFASFYWNFFIFLCFSTFFFFIIVSVIYLFYFLSLHCIFFIILILYHFILFFLKYKVAIFCFHCSLNITILRAFTASAAYSSCLPHCLKSISGFVICWWRRSTDIHPQPPPPSAANRRDQVGLFVDSRECFGVGGLSFCTQCCRIYISWFSFFSYFFALLRFSSVHDISANWLNFKLKLLYITCHSGWN